MRKIIKPWGHEIIWADTEHYLGKILRILPGHRLSKQYHVRKEETVYVLKGTLVNIDKNGKQHWLSKGQVLHIKPGQIHRFCATEHDFVELIEVSTKYIDDVIRLHDDYGR